jgi:myosin heavy subunit
MADRNLRLQVILQGLDKLTAPLKSITGASSAARRDLAKTADELQHLDKLQKQVGSYKAKESAFGADSRKLQETTARMAELRAQIDATDNPTKKLAKEFAQAERQAAALTARLDAGGAELQQLSARLSAAGIDVGDLARHEDRLSARTEQANRALRQQTAQLERVNKAKRNSDRLNDISGKATGVGLGMIGAGVATAAPVVGAVKQAMTLESAMADVSKVTNMTRPQIQRMSTDFLDMSENIPMAANELATIAAAAGAAGVGMDKLGKPLRDQRQQLLEFTNDAAST